MIVITDPRDIRGLIELKSATTADRPPNYFIDQVTDGKHVAFARRHWQTRIGLL